MELEAFIGAGLLLLLVTATAVAVFRHVGLGSVLGLLVAGVIVGPHSPGPYVTQHVEDLRHFTHLGVVFLIFLIGLEMKPSRLWAMRNQVLGLGSLQILLCGFAIGGYLWLTGMVPSVALLLGLSFALSSTAFVMQMLQERGEIASRHGVTAFSILLMQDLAVIPLLAIVPLLAGGSGQVPATADIAIGAAMIGGVWIVGARLLPRILDALARRGNHEGFLLVIILAVFFAAWSMIQAGLSMELGAFLLGVSLSTCAYRLQIQALIEPYKGLMMSMFFVAVGMSIDVNAVLAEPWPFFAQALVIMGIKVAILFGLVLAFGQGLGNAIRVSSMLAQGGEFAFILTGAALALGLIDDASFVLAAGSISLSMLATPLMVQAGQALAARLEQRSLHERFGFSRDLDPELAHRRVIIGGFGRVGQTITRLLIRSGIPVIAFDTLASRVERGQQEGFPVYFGDIADPALLSAAHTDQAPVVILTIDNPGSALRAVAHIRNHFPQVPVIARASDLPQRERLLQAGATEAFPDTLESSLRLGAQALNLIDVPADNIEMLLENIRADDYRMLLADGDAR